MGTSKHRKAHKKKLLARTQDKKRRAKEVQNLIDELQKQLANIENLESQTQNLTVSLPNSAEK